MHPKSNQIQPKYKNTSLFNAGMIGADGAGGRAWGWVPWRVRIWRPLAVAPWWVGVWRGLGWWRVPF